MSEPSEPENMPGSILPAQVKRIMIEMAGLGIKNHDDRVAELSNITGRKIGSTNDLSCRAPAEVLLTLGRAVRS